MQTACLTLLSSETQSKVIDLYLHHKILPLRLLIKQELTKLGYKISMSDAPIPILKPI